MRDSVYSSLLLNNILEPTLSVSTHLGCKQERHPLFPWRNNEEKNKVFHMKEMRNHKSLKEIKEI